MQWINLNRNDSFVNRIPLPLLCEKSRVMLVGLMAGRPVVRQNTENFQNSLPTVLIGFSQHLMKERFYHGVTSASRSVFSGKVYCEACFGDVKKWDAMFFHVDPYY